MSVNLLVRYVELAERWAGFAEILMIVFSTDEYYYKTNNQFHDCRVFYAINRVLPISLLRRLTRSGWRS